MKTEDLVLEVLQEILELGDTKPEGPFLEMGGNSLNLIATINALQERTGVKLEPRVFFEKTTSTPPALAALIDFQRAESISS